MRRMSRDIRPCAGHAHPNDPAAQETVPVIVNGFQFDHTASLSVDNGGTPTITPDGPGGSIATFAHVAVDLIPQLANIAVEWRSGSFCMKYGKKERRRIRGGWPVANGSARMPGSGFKR